MNFIMKKLLIIGVTIGLTIRTFAGPIHDAASSGDIKSVQEELDKGVDVNAKKIPFEYTPLHLAAWGGHKEIAELLIENGAKVDTKTDEARTPLHYAARFGHKGIAELLIENGADVNAKSLSQGWTPLLSAVNKSHKEIAALLIENGADVNAKSNPGWEYGGGSATSLHIGLNDIDIVELLIKSGADLNARSSINFKGRTGATPLDWAFTREVYKSAADLLRKHGARTGQEDIAYQFESLKTRIAQLETLVSETHKDTTNPTDEWPRKLWEIEIDGATLCYPKAIGLDGETIFARVMINGSYKSFWIFKNGDLYEIPTNHEKNLLYLNSEHIVFRVSGAIKMYSRVGGQVVQKEFKERLGSIEYAPTSGKGIPQSSHLAIQTVQTVRSRKFICWDFRPPAISNLDEGGGNETANSRIRIKTDGSDITLATDGMLGVAELQKSNDLRSWRKLDDVPAEANEVPLIPRESGNEFFRLKKKE